MIQRNLDSFVAIFRSHAEWAIKNVLHWGVFFALFKISNKENCNEENEI